MTDPDPVIPFRVSHATMIATTNTRVNLLFWMAGGVAVLGTGIFSYLVMH